MLKGTKKIIILIMKNSSILILIFILIVGLYLNTELVGKKLANIMQTNVIDIARNLNLNKDSVFDEIFNQSSEQQLLSEEIIFRTMRYMMEERDEYDPELVTFVRSLIVPPPPKSKKINFTVK